MLPLMNSIHIQNISFGYQEIPLFENFSLELQKDTWSCFLGPSGIGKSTLLKLIAKLVPEERVTKGEILWEQANKCGNHFSYMAQNDLLLPWLTVLDNALLPARLIGNLNSSLREKALNLLTQVGLEKVSLYYPSQLSGGMRQRVALVRTLVQEKSVVLMDEPFSALDAVTRFELQNLFHTLLKNKTVLFITHDPLEALRLASHIYVLSGRPIEVLRKVELSSHAPRSLNNPELVALQADLFEALLNAKNA